MIDFCIPLGEGIQICKNSIGLGIPNSESQGVGIPGPSGRPNKRMLPSETGPGFRKPGRLPDFVPGRNVPDDRTGLRGRQEKRTTFQEAQTVDDFSNALFCTAFVVASRKKAGVHQLFHDRSGDEIHDRNFRSSSGHDQQSIAGKKLQRVDPTLPA